MFHSGAVAVYFASEAFFLLALLGCRKQFQTNQLGPNSNNERKKEIKIY
jgi:hypothetical protein